MRLRAFGTFADVADLLVAAYLGGILVLGEWCLWSEFVK